MDDSLSVGLVTSPEMARGGGQGRGPLNCSAERPIKEKTLCDSSGRQVRAYGPASGGRRVRCLALTQTLNSAVKG